MIEKQNPTEELLDQLRNCALPVVFLPFEEEGAPTLLQLAYRNGCCKSGHCNPCPFHPGEVEAENCPTWQSVFDNFLRSSRS